MATPLIIIDTREQKPMWDPEVFNVKLQKMNEGDYTTEDLIGIAHIERKSPADLYGSIIQGHERFKRELQRAVEKNIKLAVFVECPEEMFFLKRFPRGHKLQTPTSTLRKIVGTMKIKYNIEFVWCEDRDDMADKMLIWFAHEREQKELKEKESEKSSL